MESSSEEEDDFPTHEWITPQSHIHSVYQSHTEKGVNICLMERLNPNDDQFPALNSIFHSKSDPKVFLFGIRKLCSELLDLKDAVENMCGNMHSKYSAFLRISEEVVEMEQELIELQKHVSSQGILVQDLISGACHELEEWNKTSEESDCEEELESFDINELLKDEMEDTKLIFLQELEVLLAEHKTDEALVAIEKEEALHPELKDLEECLLNDNSSYKVAFLEKKATLVDLFVEVYHEPFVGINELKKVTLSLIKLGKGPKAHKLLLESFGSHLRTKMEVILSSCSMYADTYGAVLSQLVFSTILLATKESYSVFGDSTSCKSRIMKWAEYELEFFVQQVRDNCPLLETASALRSTSICLQASLSHCSHLKSVGLHFYEVLMVLFHPYVEEILGLNFEQARGRVPDISGNDDGVVLSPELCLPLSAAATSNLMLTNSGKKFMSIVMDILEQLTPTTFMHFGDLILNHLLALFGKYVESLIRALPGTSEDDSIVEHNEGIDFRVETDAQQLALLGTAFTVADELLPSAISRILTSQHEIKETGCQLNSESCAQLAVTDLKDWRRRLQHLVDKLRDHFCRQYVLTFIYSREGKARMDARMYLNGIGEDILWDSDPLPSLPFQGLFARLKQLASVAYDVLGKEKLQKILLARLIETVVIWLSDEQEFWEVFDDESIQLKPVGLQQLILDMHFIVEIAVLGGYPSRNVHQLVSTIIARAVGAFSKRGIDPQSALPEDEWFVETAKTAINKLLLGTSGSEASEADTDNDVMIIHDEISNSDGSCSSPLSLHSVDSFASANMDEIESPGYFTDPEP